MSIQSSSPADQCPLCGRPNGCLLCGVASYKGPCWCAGIMIPDLLLARVSPEKRNAACICAECVRSFHSDQKNRPANVLQPGDFYFDANGLIVQIGRASCRERV